MGVVVLQLGQGGNQMGYALFDSLTSLSASPPPEFFRLNRKSNLIARSVLVDTEPKVITAMMRKAKLHSAQGWIYSNHNQVTRDSGSGNNWARGFHEYGPNCREAILDLVRHEVEECDMFGGFVTLQSMAGGTGAGLGAYMVEALYDEFPSSFILSHCIWPFESGEVVVQNYNVLLTLSHLQGISDGIILVQNEQLSTICKNQLGIQRPSFVDMNSVATEALAGIFLPSNWRPTQPTQSTPQPTGQAMDRDHQQQCFNLECDHYHNFEKPRVRLLCDLLGAICAHPGYRLLTLRFTPQVPKHSLDYTAFTWRAQLKHLRQMFITGAHRELELDWSVSLPNGAGSAASRTPNYSINRSIANVLVLRGKGSDNVEVGSFMDERMYPIWSVDPLSVAASPTPLGDYDMAMSLLSNCQSAVFPASRALSRAYNMHSAKAYLHQYMEQGMEMDAFDQAFATTEDVVSRYLTL